MLQVDLLIAVLVIWGAVAGYRHGFIAVVLDLAGFILAAVAASVFYHPLGQAIANHWRVIPSFASVLAYGLVFLVVEVLYFVAAHWLSGYLPPHAHHSKLNRYSGAVSNAVKVLVLIAIALVIFDGLPITATAKEAVDSARLPRILATYTRGLQSQVNHLIGQDLTNTINFFTVKPESEDSIKLGFTTTNVKIDEADEQRMLALVNRERTSRGLRALVMNDTAQTVAREHSRDMFARGYFSHITPEGQDPFDRMKAGGVQFGAAGENLALAPTLETAHNGLMNSPGHRANILSPDYRTVGIGIIDGGPYGLMITQDFTD